MAALRQAGIAVPRVCSAGTRGHAVGHEFLLRLASILAAQDPPVVMVLDDLHRLTDADTLDGLAYVLKNAQPGLHLVVSSRMDPILPLHRYRLTGELTEIRADDLAFSVAESGSLLAHHGLALSDRRPRVPHRADRRLGGRACGWPRLSLEGHPDPEQFVKELDAEDGAVTSYLVDRGPECSARTRPRSAAADEHPGLRQRRAGRELGDDEQAPVRCPTWPGRTPSSGRSGTGGIGITRCSPRYWA